MAEGKQPALADLVLANRNQTEAEKVTDFIWMIHDSSNAYLVTTKDGDVMVNTGFSPNAEKNVTLLAPRRTGPLRYIVLTQSHPDHFGGLKAFREPETKVVGGPGFEQALFDMMDLQPYFGPRVRKLWGAVLGNNARPPDPGPIEPDVLVDRDLTLELGERTFQLISAPEGETVDNLVVWMPREKVAFIGNVHGPVWLSFPFLNTLRGDKPRLIQNYLKAMRRIRDLGAELLITGHGQPIVGAEQIRADLTKMIDAAEWVRTYTLEGMKAGKDVHTLMREVKMPEHLRIGEFHGKVSWGVKSIWREYSGWFHYEDGTTDLFGVPRRSVHDDITALAGGADKLAARARQRLQAGEPLEALHLVEIALNASPGERSALEVKRDASALLLERSGGQNLSETMWLRSEIAECEEALG
ncbi:MAG: MBL fold metallo-hydrolase [Novosphingobium sp.]|nr:MBL fold metallo-hydrolase [Novosphingobium sp.]